jgi:hypothetical protein
MDMEVVSKEQRILRQMHKTLGNIVRDISITGGRPNPLTNDTMQDIKVSLGLISEREQELTGKFNIEPPKPQSAESKQTGSSTLNFVKLPKR